MPTGLLVSRMPMKEMVLAAIQKSRSGPSSVTASWYRRAGTPRTR